jgi:hypothetical protein
MRKDYNICGILKFKNLEIFNDFVKDFNMDNKHSKFLTIDRLELAVRFNDKIQELPLDSDILFNKITEAIEEDDIVIKDSELLAYSESEGFEVMYLLDGNFTRYDGYFSLKTYFGEFRFNRVISSFNEFDKLIEEFVFGDTKLGELRELVEEDIDTIFKEKVKIKK